MKPVRVPILLAALGCLATAWGEPPDRTASDAFETARIKSGLAKAGLNANYEIVVGNDRDLVEDTAAQLLQRFLRRASLVVEIVPESRAASGKRRILLGRDANLLAIRTLGGAGAIDIRGVSAEDDGFHLKSIGRDIIIAGANPRGVLYGMYAFEDFIEGGAGGRLDLRKIPRFRKRASGPEYSFNRHANISIADLPEEKIAYLSRMGVNQLTDQGIGNLDALVESDVFPNRKAFQPELRRKVLDFSAICRKYGIEPYLWIHAPEIAGDEDAYPKEAIGVVKRPWGGDRHGLGKTLCVSSPLVQKHYAGMMRKLVREYPDVKGVLFYNLDARSFLCTPALCPRCQAVCRDSPPDLFNPWETQARLVTLLAESAKAENPAFDFRFWGAVHYHDEHFEKMIRATTGFGSLAASWTGSDRSIMVPDAAQPTTSFMLSRKIARERGVPFHLLCELNNLEQVPKSLPFPFHISDALKKFDRWGVENLTEIYGMVPEHNQVNSLIMREFQWNPEQNPEKVIANLSVRQFGEKAGRLAYQSWEQIAQAFDAWNDISTSIFPLAGSQFMLSLGTSIGGLPPPVLPDVVNYYDNLIQILTNVEPWFADDYQRYKSRAFLDKMERMNAHLLQAEELAKQAVSAASDKEFVDFAYYEGPDGRPTRRQYAELNYAPIAIAESHCRQRHDILRAYLLLKQMEMARQSGDGVAAKAQKNLYLKLVREDLGVQERFCELLRGFSQLRPCYTRTSLTEQEIADFLSLTEKKIEKLKEHLAAEGA